MAAETDPPFELTMEQYIDFTPDGLTLDDQVDTLCAELGLAIAEPVLPVMSHPPMIKVEERTPSPKLSTPTVPDLLPQPFEWCEIPAGPFLMGSDPEKDSDAQDNEMPQITIDLPTYYMAKYPVTYAQYEVFVNDDGYTNDAYWTDDGRKWPGKKRYPEAFWKNRELHIADHPVVGVTWFEAWAFIQWLGVKVGMDVRLPTEPQWEKAARGDDGRVYPWGNQAPDKNLCNFGDNIGKSTSVTKYSVGQSPYGVFDMAGNVWEWCLTKREWSYIDGPSSADNGLNGECNRILRGGSWQSSKMSARSVFRNGYYRYMHEIDFGFRVCVVASQD